MALVLKIVLGVVIGGLLLILLGYFAVRILLWRLGSNLKKSIGDLGNLFEGMDAKMIQTEIDLEPAGESDLDEPAIEKLRDLEKLGFARAGVFEVEGQGIYLATLADAENRCWASITQSPIDPAAVDIVSHHTDGRWITHMSMKDLGLKPPPGIEKNRVPGAAPGELFKRHLAERPAGDYEPASIENVEAGIRQAVRDEGLLRAWRGGLSEDELEKNMNAVGEGADAQATTMAAIMARGQAAEVLDEAFTQAYQEQTDLSVSEWEKVEDDLLIVHPMTDVEEMADALDMDEAGDMQGDMQGDEFGGGTVKLQKFADANAALPEDKRLRVLGPVELRAANQTLRADIYVRREEEDDDDYDD